MQDKILQKISDIHKSNIKFVIVSSGGGSNAIASLLKVPGASNSILESYIPYSRESLDFYLLKQPDFYCSKDTSLRMAAKAYSAAKKIDQELFKEKSFWRSHNSSSFYNLSKRREIISFILLSKLKIIPKAYLV